MDANTFPSPFAVISSGLSKAYARVAKMQVDTMIGRYLFDVFPDKGF